jgi:pyruvate ferredoxin oxidoreductase alpha subunit
MHRAVENALQVHEEASADFHRLFGRRYGAFEEYRMEDAEIVLVMTGSFSTKGKSAVNRWRDQGRKVGLLRLRLIRPRPTAALAQALSGRKAVGVIDQNISPGLGGILYQEVAAVLASIADRPGVVRSFIGGLGGKDIGQAEFDRVLESLAEEQPGDQPSQPELLFTASEWEQVRKVLSIAGKSVEEASP